MPMHFSRCALPTWLLVVVACSSSSTSDGTGSVQGADDSLPSDSADAAGATPTEVFDPDQMKFPNGVSVAEYARSRGITPQVFGLGIRTIPATAKTTDERRMDVIAAMILAAAKFMNRASWSPQHNGLAYSYGAKDPTQSTKPAASGCAEPVQGLDCSGLVSLCARAASVIFDVNNTNATMLSDPKAWKLPPDWQLTMMVVNDGTHEMGDIIAWPGKHVGMAAGPGGAVVAQSNGYVGPDRCAENRDDKHGPRAVALSAMLKTGPRQWNLGVPVVLRLSASCQPLNAGCNNPGEVCCDGVPCTQHGASRFCSPP